MICEKHGYYSDDACAECRKDETAEAITWERLQALRHRARALVEEFLPGMGAYIKIDVHNAPEAYVDRIALLPFSSKYVETQGHSEYDVANTPVLDDELAELTAFGRKRELTREHCPACKSGMDCAVHGEAA